MKKNNEKIRWIRHGRAIIGLITWLMAFYAMFKAINGSWVALVVGVLLFLASRAYFEEV